MEIKIRAKSFKRVDSPVMGIQRERFIFLANVKDLHLSRDLVDWMEINPREQNTSTNVAKKIEESLMSEENLFFHELNRGILFSADRVRFDNKDDVATIWFENNAIHGNIDGGHTLKIILENLPETDKFVLIEVITGLTKPEVVELAEARNTSVQVDRLSIEELTGTFESIKNILKDEPWFSRVKFKQNQLADPTSITIDFRTIISILNLFNENIIENSSSIQPTSAYSAKETNLKRFIDWTNANSDYGDFFSKNKNELINIIKLFDKIQKELPEAINNSGFKYGSLKFSNFENDKKNGLLFSTEKVKYDVPLSLIFPLLNAFRANLKTNNKNKNVISWELDPFKLWEDFKLSLAKTLMDNLKQLANNPNALGKSTSVWQALYNMVKIFVIENKK